MNIMHVFQQGDIVLTSVFILLISMSVVSWYIIFWKGLKLRQERRLYQEFRRHYITSPDWPKHNIPNNVPGSINTLLEETRSIEPVLANYSSDGRHKLIAMHLSQSLDLIRSWLDKGLTVLASIGSSAPFIGLFGTVWGIYGALADIAAAGNAGLSVVAGPMGEALVATAVGLFAAIPAVLAYNAFVRVNRLLVQDLRHIAEHLTAYLSLPSIPKDTGQNVKTMRSA